MGLITREESVANVVAGTTTAVVDGRVVFLCSGGKACALIVGGVGVGVGMMLWL